MRKLVIVPTRLLAIILQVKMGPTENLMFHGKPCMESVFNQPFSRGGDAMRKLFTMILLVPLSGIGLQVAAQHPRQHTDRSGSQPQQQTNASSQQSARTFQGKIARADEQLVFWDPSSQTAYQVDDQSKVAPYEGKNVKLRGTVDTKTNTLHVVDVAPAGK
jgi:hypothetical protein